MREVVWRVQGQTANACQGEVEWAPFKSLWNNGLLLTALTLGPIYFSWGALVCCLVLGYVTMLLGHSLGMHRRLIHQAFTCSKPLERFLVWLGVLVGMAGPFGIIRVHDIRDWAQREPACHDFFSHRRGLIRDALWQLNCTFRFERPPRFTLEPAIAQDPWYRWMDATWPLHQFALAACLCAIGGVAWVVWGVAVRVAVSVASHWVVTYFAHHPGRGRWRVPDAGVQASNLPWIAFLTHGECWHNNHHAFPESAQLGLEPGQMDTGWQVLRLLQWCGVVSRIGTPRPAEFREDLVLEPSGFVDGSRK